MSIGSWTPTKETKIDRDFLIKAIHIAEQNLLASLSDHISDEETVRYAAIMRLPQPEWTSALEVFSNEHLRLLIRFFASAEMSLPGWEAGDTSPAIWANKLLRQRGERLGPEELLWLREHSNNRYIPNGRL